MLVSEMAHMCLINIASDEPAHGAANHDVGGKMLLGGDPGGAYDPGQAVGGDLNDGHVLVFVGVQGGDGPHLDGMAGGEGSTSAPEVSRMAFVGAVATGHFFQNSGYHESVD